MRLLQAASLLLVWTGAGVAQAGELQVDLGVTGKGSTWHGDGGGGFQLRLGYRFLQRVAVDVAVWEELHAVDVRENTGLTVGATGYLPLKRLRPSLRAYFIHQHEQGLVSVVKNPLATLVGIGDGIRHRAGFGFALGVEGPIFARGALEVYVSPALTATIFPDAELGPGFYFGGAISIGLNLNRDASG